MDGYIDGGFPSVDDVWFDCCHFEAGAMEEGPKAPLNAGLGTFFDEYLDFRGPGAAPFVARILELYDSVRPRERRRGREALTTRIRKLTANAIRGHFFRELPSVLYFKKADSPSYADSPSWMKHGSLGKVVDAMMDAGLLNTITGKMMLSNSKIPSWASSFSASEKLINVATECGINERSIVRYISTERLVQLFGPKPRREYDWSKGGIVRPRRGNLIKYEQTLETLEWTSTLEEVNAFYRRQDIGLRLSPDEMNVWLAHCNSVPERTGAPYKKLESFKTDVYRVFNDGDEANPQFTKGGRLFGGWWMSIPEGLREAISINGQPTVEIDYAECHTRMLYHDAGLDGGEGLYILPELAEYEVKTGASPGTYRPYVKWLTQVMINCRGRPEAVEKPDKIIMPRDFTVKEIIGFIETRHNPIAASFKTGAGLALMRLESEIALEIVSRSMAEGWTVLSVHDSMICAVDKEDSLRSMMIESYFAIFGKEPAFK